MKKQPAPKNNITKLSVWPVLRAAAGEDGITVDELCAEIAATKPEGMPLDRALRCYAVGHLMGKPVQS
jgi:hypothetical protein